MDIFKKIMDFFASVRQSTIRMCQLILKQIDSHFESWGISVNNFIYGLDDRIGVSASNFLMKLFSQVIELLHFR